MGIRVRSTFGGLGDRWRRLRRFERRPLLAPPVPRTLGKEVQATASGLDGHRAFGRQPRLPHELSLGEAAAVDDDAPGLRAITSLKVDARRNQKSVYRTPKAGEPDVRDFLVQEQISVQFQADEPTALAFFESCRKPNRTANTAENTWAMA